MSTRRLVTAFFMALLTSGFLTYLISRKITKPISTRPAAVRHVVVASRELHSGDLLTAGDMETMEWSATKPFPGAYENAQAISGRILTQAISSGEPIMSHYLSPVGTGAGLATRIPDGMRAISLRSDEAASVAGFLQPGSIVDVLVTSHNETSATLTSSTVLQGVRVIAVGEKTEVYPEQKLEGAVGTVTLLAKLQDAEKLVLANARGRITFVLRNGRDTKIESEASPDTMPFAVKAAAASSGHWRAMPKNRTETPASHFIVETVAGGKSTSQIFEGERQ